MFRLINIVTMALIIAFALIVVLPLASDRAAGRKTHKTFKDESYRSP